VFTSTGVPGYLGLLWDFGSTPVKQRSVRSSEHDYDDRSS
jgi:hypothetical protein